MPDQNFIYKTTIKVNSFECDINRRWKPSAFFQYLTETAGKHADQLGCGFETMVAKNMYWVHSRMKIKFHRFPQDGEELTITTWPKTIQQKLFFVRDYEVHTTDGKLLATASSAWLVIDANLRRMVPPQATGLDLPSVSDRIGLDEPLDRLGVPDDGEHRLTLTAGYSAVDMLGHVNNSRYVDWICDSFPMDKHRNATLEWLQVNYDKEIMPGEEVALKAQNSLDDPAIWSVQGQNQTNGTRAFEAMLKWKNNPE